MHAKNWMFLTIIFLLLSSCSLMAVKETPAVRGTEAPDAGAMGTAVEPTTMARTTEIAGKTSATATDTPTSISTETPAPSPTPCAPLVTAKNITNVYSGPDTTQDVVGTLPEDGTANLTGRNDTNTWWYIEFSEGAGGHAWVSGAAVTPSCLPSVVQIIAVSATSLPKPRTSIGSSISISDVKLPDLVASEMHWSPSIGKKNQPLTILAKVTNNGTAPADDFIVVWLSDGNKPGCDWTVSGLDEGASVILDCQFTYTTENYPKTTSFLVTLKVDSENQVTESNESKDSNSYYAQITIRK
jgi:hypothetical protein